MTNHDHDTGRDCVKDYNFVEHYDKVDLQGAEGVTIPATCETCGRELEVFFQYRGIFDPEIGDYVYEA